MSLVHLEPPVPWHARVLLQLELLVNTQRCGGRRPSSTSGTVKGTIVEGTASWRKEESLDTPGDASSC